MNSERSQNRLYYTSIQKSMHPDPEISQQSLQATAFICIFFAANVCSAYCPFDAKGLTRFTGLCNYSTAGVYFKAKICCEEIYGAAIYYVAKYGNYSGVMHGTSKRFVKCVHEFWGNLTSIWNLRPEFFRNQCPLPDFTRLPANKSCVFRHIADLLRLVNLTDASQACGIQIKTPAKTSCQNCQAEILNASLKLSGITGGQPSTCGTSIAIALISTNPDVIIFQNFYACVLQMIGTMPNPGFRGIIASPGSASTSGKRNSVKESSDLSSKTLIILIGVLGGVATVAFLALAGICIVRSNNSEYAFPNFFSATGSPMPSDSSEPAVALPKEGFYIFTLRELAKATHNFSNSHVIGEGSAGMVFAGQLPSGKLIAVKRILKEKNIETFYKEVDLLARIRHPNLTALLGYCQSKTAHLLVYEYMSNGDLDHNLLDKKLPALPWDIRIRIAIDCAMGLTYLHEYPDGPIIHRDIKPRNILLNGVMSAQLSDFGLSKVLGMEASHISTEVRGTSGYLDPEYLILGQLTESSDVYSFGVVLLQLITGRKAIDNDLQLNRYVVQSAFSVMNGEVELKDIIDPRLEGHYSYAAFRKLMEVAYNCVQSRSYDRPSILEVLDGLELAMRIGKSHPPSNR